MTLDLDTSILIDNKGADTPKRIRPIEYVPFVKTIKLKMRTISYRIVLFTNMKENYLNTNYLTYIIHSKWRMVFPQIKYFFNLSRKEY